MSQSEVNFHITWKCRQVSDSKIHILRLMGYYTPDFAYIDINNNVFIDIEIDEPYTPRQYPNSESELKLTHYLGADNTRNEYFINCNWIVVRFSEFQILNYSDACCYYLAQLVYLVTEDESILKNFSGEFKLPIDKIWTYDEAKIMANNRQRLKYSPPYFKLVNSSISGSANQTASLLPSDLFSTSKSGSAATKRKNAYKKKMRAINAKLTDANNQDIPTNLSPNNIP